MLVFHRVVVLVLFLYNIYANDSFKIFDNSNCECVIYADDTTFVVKASDLVTVCFYLNVYILRFSYWYKCNKLKLNPSKTKWMYFSPKIVHNYPTVLINNVCIEKVNNFV